MSSAPAPSLGAPASPVQRPSDAPRRPRKRFRIRGILAALAVFAALGVAAWSGVRAYRTVTGVPERETPTAQVQRGDLSMAVNAKAELRGGNPEVLTAPLIGAGGLHITYLPEQGQPVNAGDTVVRFDTAEQEYKLLEAEADLAEAEQRIILAQAQREAEQEEDRYSLSKARSDIQLAELEVRKNPLLPALTARQNNLALDAAREHLAQLERTLANRQRTNDASIAMQEAGKGKAESQAATARQNIELMTIRAKRSGYVSIKQNVTGGILFFGMTLPLFQVGDEVRPGMAVAEIPDLSNWELGANIGELDRGHLSPGEKVAVSIIAAPGRSFTGHVKEIGSSSGPPWDRHFECKIALDSSSPELRPGMSANIVITTDEMHNVLWLPAQALFESDGRTFVYVRSGASFTPKDVTLVRRNETQVVLSGLEEGQEVALANPAETAKKKAASAAPSLPK